MYLNRLGCCRDPETSFWLLFSNLYRRQPVLVTVPYTRIKPSDIGRAPQSSLDCPDDRYGSEPDIPALCGNGSGMRVGPARHP